MITSTSGHASDGPTCHMFFTPSTAALLQLQLQIYAAALDDPKLRELGRAKWAEMWRVAASLSGAPPAEVLEFLSVGMLVNVLTAFEVPYQPGDKLADSLDAWAAER
jgi:hypothetical protein